MSLYMSAPTALACLTKVAITLLMTCGDDLRDRNKIFCNFDVKKSEKNKNKKRWGGGNKHAGGDEKLLFFVGLKCMHHGFLMI